MSKPKTGKDKREMKILCLGMSRTGTISLRAAFATLGYHGTYHYTVPTVEEPAHGAFWQHALRKKYEKHQEVTREEFDTVYANYEAVTDAPSVFFWRELLEAYPDAQVILQTRPMEVWFKSHMKNIWAFSWEFYGPVGLNPYWWLFRLFQPRGPFWDFSGLVSKYGHGIDSPEQVRRNYSRHNASVREYCQQVGRPYLEYDVVQGWEPLCEFLGKEVPANEPFPRLNDTKSFQEEWKPMLTGVRRDIHRKMAVLVSAVVGTISVALWYYGPGTISSV